jgi:integrase
MANPFRMRQRGGKLYLDSKDGPYEVKGDGDYSDGGNLVLQIRGRSESWALRYVSPVTGKTRYMGGGPRHTVSLDEAREWARQQRLLLLKSIDPLQQREDDDAARQREKAKDIKFGQLAWEWVEVDKVGWEPGTLKETQRRLQKYIQPKLGNRPIKDFDMTLPDSLATQIMEDFLKPFWRTKTDVANKCRTHIEAILNRALAARLIRGDNAASMRKGSPLRVLLKSAAEVHRKKTYAHLPFEQLPEFMAKVDRLIETGWRTCQVCRSPHIKEINAAHEAGVSLRKLAVQFGIGQGSMQNHFEHPRGAAKVHAPRGALATRLVVLVPARKMQVAAAEWKHIKEVEGIRCLASPAQKADGRQGHKTGKKTGKDYVVPLSKQAEAVLETMKQWQTANGIKSDYVFPSNRGVGHLSQGTVNSILRTTLGYAITAHGFRHTFGNWAHRNGYSEMDSEIALGHIIGDKSRNSYKDDIMRLHAVRDMVQAYANYCDRGAPLPEEKVRDFVKEKAARRA